MRLSPPDFDNFTEEQKRVFAIIANGPRGHVRGALAMWLHRPEFAEAAQALGAYSRFSSSLSLRLVEIGVLTLIVAWKAEFAWWGHSQIALKAGLSPDVIEAIRTGQRPQLDSAEDYATYELALALGRDRAVPKELHDRAIADLGPDRTIDLIGVLGYYGIVCMTVVTFDLVAEGQPRQFGPQPD
ncbi:carboxymuconolactone decarboxylase [Agrobacterium tumefaciens str. Cherry 2E-2-2]|nr:carboxymuconolactone decarboxylase [Agrobacterium tumefaciens str. Cherry 2E-2-2]